jgi:hypothetical protein
MAARGERIERQLLRGPERDLNLDRHAGWCLEAEDFVGAAVTRHRRNPGSRSVNSSVVFVPRKKSVSSPLAKNVLGPAEPAFDRPALDLDRAVAGTGLAADDGVEAWRQPCLPRSVAVSA